MENDWFSKEVFEDNSDVFIGFYRFTDSTCLLNAVNSKNPCKLTATFKTVQISSNQ